MQIFLLVIIIAFHCTNALTPQQIKKLKPIAKACQEESQVSEEVLNHLRDTRELLDDPKLKKQILCVMKRVGFMTESGDFVDKKFRKHSRKIASNEQDAEHILNECVQRKSTPEETAFEIVKCFHRHNPNSSPVE